MWIVNHADYNSLIMSLVLSDFQHISDFGQEVGHTHPPNFSGVPLSTILNIYKFTFHQHADTCSNTVECSIEIKIKDMTAGLWLRFLVLLIQKVYYLKAEKIWQWILFLVWINFVVIPFQHLSLLLHSKFARQFDSVLP